MSETAFELLAPEMWHMPAVFNSPHSGTSMPASLLSQSSLSKRQLRQSEDCFVDELFMGCLDSGAPLFKSNVSRAYVDLNREPYELDARMFLEALPRHVNAASPRVVSGFGTIPRCVGDGLEIYRSKLHLAEAFARIDTIYRPYHRALAGLLDEAYRRAGLVLLVDCHSMPGQPSGSKPVPDVVLGDRFGTSCSQELVANIDSFFTAQGLRVAHNKPYAGGFITATYGAPQNNRHAIQIELNRSLYMNESTLERSAGFAATQKLLTSLCSHLAKILKEMRNQVEMRDAAE